jgi:hypothetical protein
MKFEIGDNWPATGHTLNKHSGDYGEWIDGEVYTPEGILTVYADRHGFNIRMALGGRVWLALQTQTPPRHKLSVRNYSRLAREVALRLAEQLNARSKP